VRRRKKGKRSAIAACAAATGTHGQRGLEHGFCKRQPLGRQASEVPHGG
jgi:hypothetical protein